MHDSVANATPRAHESARVNELLPEQLRGSSQNLVNFLKEYYDYLNQDGLPSKELRHIVVENDIDETSAKYLDSIQDEIASIVPNSDYMDRVTLYKRIVHYYRSKGTIEAVYTFFRIFFNDVDDLQIEYGDKPYTYRIRTSKLPAGGEEWRSKFRKLAHPAGLKFNVSTLVETGVVGGGDLSKVRPGWDADYWTLNDDREDYYDSEGRVDDWYRDLVPPNRRSEITDSEISNLDPFTAYFLSKYEPPVDVLVRTLVDAQAGLRWRSGSIDRISGDDYAANIYGDDSDGEIYGDPPAEIIESRVLDIMFVMSPFLEDARDSFVHTQYQAQDKFFDPGESIGSYAKLDFNDLEKEFDFSVNRSPFSVFGADVDIIPHTLKFLEGVNDSDDANINDRASEDGDGLRIQLNSATSAGNNFKFNINFENDNDSQGNDLQDSEYTLYDDSDNYNDSQGDAFLIVRPERYQDYNTAVLHEDYYVAGTSTTAYLKVYQANFVESDIQQIGTPSTTTVGVPLVISAENGATAINASYRPTWGWGNIGTGGEIDNISFFFKGAGFTTTHTVGQIARQISGDDVTSPVAHYLIKFGTAFYHGAYEVGDQFFAGDNLYEVTTAGTGGGSDPTSTSTTPFTQHGTLQIKYVGKVAKAVVRDFTDETNEDVATLGGINNVDWITHGSGYRTFAPNHSNGSAYDKSRFRLGSGNSASHAVRYTSFIQDTVGTSTTESDGVNYRPWFYTNGSDKASSPLQWHYQNTQLTNGNTSTIRLDIVDDVDSEETSRLTVRSLDYRTLTDSIFIEE